MLLFISLCSVEFFGGAFHAAYYFISNTHNMSAQANFLYPSTVDNFKGHLEILSYLGVPGFLIGTILFFKLALNKRFPAWFRYANPLILCGVIMLIFMVLPAPIGGYLKPTFVNLGLASMFLLSLKTA